MLDRFGLERSFVTGQTSWETLSDQGYESQAAEQDILEGQKTQGKKTSQKLVKERNRLFKANGGNDNLSKVDLTNFIKIIGSRPVDLGDFYFTYMRFHQKCINYFLSEILYTEETAYFPEKMIGNQFNLQQPHRGSYPVVGFSWG